MKLYFEIDVPDDTQAVDLKELLQEFHWLARLRGWRALLTLPKIKKNTHLRLVPEQPRA